MDVLLPRVCRNVANDMLTQMAVCRNLVDVTTCAASVAATTAVSYAKLLDGKS